MHPDSESLIRYFPSAPGTAEWGWKLVDAGRQRVAPGARYPGRGHPLGYLFDASGRRTLDEYQIVFVISGSGTFESASCKRTEISAGDAFLLFPGEWHRYGPSRESGWSEYWMGFDGDDARRVMEAFFLRSLPVHRGAFTDEILRLFDRLQHLLSHPIAGGEQVLASFAPMVLAYLRAGGQIGEGEAPNDRERIITAKSRMLASLSRRSDLQALAREAGMSYSRFRAVFKKETGYSPREFENIIKLNRSRDLLLSGRFNVSQAAEALGFSSVYYFSRAFRKAFGLSPQKWLKARCSGNEPLYIRE